jgi:YegS/Rv2252/BmrU family lipid kinase
MKSAILFNPRAGRYPCTGIVQRAALRIRQLGWEVSTLETKRPGDMQALAKQAADSGAGTVFVAGGDGSISAVADTLVGSQVALGVIPVGTANVWARELGLPRLSRLKPSGVDSLVTAQLEGAIRPVDLGRCKGSHFLLWAGFGLDAHMIRRTEPRSRYVRPLGALYYSMAAFRGLRDWRSRPIQVSAGGTTISCKQALLVVITNIRLYAGGWGVLDPQARTDDGQMSAWVFPGQRFGDIVSLFIHFLRGQHARLPGVTVLKGGHFEITSPEPLGLHLDAEYAGQAAHLVVEVVPSGLQVLVPKGAFI